MSCCDNIILRMLPEPLPGVLCAELSDGTVVCFDRSYLDQSDAETRELLQAGLMPQSMIDEYRRLRRRGTDADVLYLTRWAED
jgi:hypothetical protein